MEKNCLLQNENSLNAIDNMIEELDLGFFKNRAIQTHDLLKSIRDYLFQIKNDIQEMKKYI
jgi:hypothetical protein